MKKIFLMAVFVCASAFSLAFSQVVTASDFFKNVSDYYATISDYEADIDIKAGNSSMSGRVSFKRPEMLRIDFEEPSEQVILFNGDKLTIYVPGSSAILEQSVESGSNAAAVAGLTLLRRYYSVQYEFGQEAVPLDEGSSERVISLVLKRRSSSEAFTTIKLAIDPATNLIRRVHAVTQQNETFVFDFYNYRLNSNIPESRFLYDPPSSANNYNNFLFSE